MFVLSRGLKELVMTVIYVLVSRGEVQIFCVQTLSQTPKVS